METFGNTEKKEGKIKSGLTDCFGVALYKKYSMKRNRWMSEYKWVSKKRARQENSWKKTQILGGGKPEPQ